MARVKEIEDKAKAPKIDRPAVKRFVRNALWQQAHQQASEQTAGESRRTNKLASRQQVRAGAPTS